MNPQHLDRVLEAAIIAHWPDLMPNDEHGVIHLEYDVADDGTVSYFRVWSSTVHGYWRLLCTFGASAGNDPNQCISFESAHQPETLARVLCTVMQHQNKFLPSPKLGRQGLLQIGKPSLSEKAEAVVKVHEALAACDSFDNELAVA